MSSDMATPLPRCPAPAPSSFLIPASWVQVAGKTLERTFLQRFLVAGLGAADRAVVAACVAILGKLVAREDNHRFLRSLDGGSLRLVVDMLAGPDVQLLAAATEAIYQLASIPELSAFERGGSAGFSWSWARLACALIALVQGSGLRQLAGACRCLLLGCRSTWTSWRTGPTTWPTCPPLRIRQPSWTSPDPRSTAGTMVCLMLMSWSRATPTWRCACVAGELGPRAEPSLREAVAAVVL